MGQDWKPFSWYCPDCGELVTGYKGNDGIIKVSCKSCYVVMIREVKSRRHDTIDVYQAQKA